MAGKRALSAERRVRASALWLVVAAAAVFVAGVALPTDTWIPKPYEIRLDDDLRRFLHDAPGQHTGLVRLGALLFRACLVIDGALLLWAATALRRGARGRGGPGGKATRSRSEDGTSLFSLGLLLAIGAGLRLYHLNQDLWLDEISTLVRFARLPLANIVASVPSSNNHVLNSVLGHVSLATLGESAAALRLPAMLFGVGGIWATFYLGRLVASAPEALGAAALLTVSYPHVFFSQNARGYSAHLFFALLATAWLIQAVRGGGRRYWAGYVAAMVLLNYSHLLGLFTLGAHVAAYGVRLWDRRELTLASPTTRALALASALILFLTFHLYALSVPEIIGLVVPEYSQPAVGWTPSSPVVHGLAAGLLARPLLIAALLGGAGLALAGALHYLRLDRFALALLTFPPLVTLAALLVFRVGIYPRFFLFAIPAGYLLVIGGARLGIAATWRRLGGAERRVRLERLTATALIAVALAGSIGQLRPYYRLPKQDYTGALNYVAAANREQAPVVAVGPAAWGLKLYDRRVYATNSVSEIAGLRSGCHPLWLVYSFAHEMRVEMPTLFAYIQSEFQPVAEFPGTLLGGTLFVVKSRCPG